MAFAEHDGVKLFYEEAGSGDPPLVFVHGWCCDHTYFQPQFDHFKSSHRVIAVDLRGHGQSDKPQISYTMDLFADAIDAVMRDAKVEHAQAVVTQSVAHEWRRNAVRIGQVGVEHDLVDRFG